MSEKEKSRYSDSELQEFKELITEKLENSRNELKYLQEANKMANGKCMVGTKKIPN